MSVTRGGTPGENAHMESFCIRRWAISRPLPNLYFLAVAVISTYRPIKTLQRIVLAGRHESLFV
jgi:hypothetical protein